MNSTDTAVSAIRSRGSMVMQPLPHPAFEFANQGVTIEGVKTAGLFGSSGTTVTPLMSMRKFSS